MMIALLLLALDESSLPTPPLVLELRTVERLDATADPVVELALVNRSGKPVKVVKPGDGSECGWREPYVFWSAEEKAPDGEWASMTPKPYGRCGLFAAHWEKDVVELAPGERLVLRDWLRPVNRTFLLKVGHRYRLTAHYQYRARASSKGVDAAPVDGGPMKGVKPFEIKSRPAEFNVAGELPKEVQEAFAKAESIELYSLSPFRELKPTEGFRGWLIMGKTIVKEPKAVLEAVEKGAKDSDGKVAKCFEPRHGIRAGDVDLVICFACLQTYVYQGEKRVASFPTTREPAALLNKILSNAGIPLAGDSPKK